jgi:tetratricopeptide (TPR) repeat protein
LLAALAQSLGIDVRPVLIHSVRKDVTEDAPSPQQFDHVISVARLGPDPAGWLWMDATNNFAPAGYLTANLRDTRGLLVEADGRGVLVRTPADPPFEPRVGIELDGVLEASGTLRAHVRWTFRSDLEVLLRAGFTTAPRERHDEMVRSTLAREWKDGKVSNVSFSDPAQVAEPFRLEFDVERSVTGRRSDREWPLWVPLPEFGLPAADALADAEARSSRGPDRLEARATFRLPAGGRARAPLAVALERPFGALTSTYSVDAGALQLTRSVRVDLKAAAAADRAAYESFRRAVETDHEQDFFVAPLDAASATAESLHEAGKAAMAEKAYDRAVDLLLQAVDRDPQRADVWNELGRALRDSGDAEAALAAFSAQIEANPFDETAYAERAYVLIEKLDRFDEAEADLLKQIEVAPFKAWSYAKLGTRRAGQRRFAEAAKYYAQAATAEPKNKGYWVDLGWAQAESGQHEPARATFAHARTLDLEDWQKVRVARGLSLTGDHALAAEMAVEALPSLAARSSKLNAENVTLGDAYWTERMAEAWYLVGSAALARGDLAEAERHLNASWKAQFVPGTAVLLGALRTAQQRPDEAAAWFAVSASFPGAADAALPKGIAPLSADARSDAERMMQERTITLTPLPLEDFNEDVLLLIDAGGRLSSARGCRRGAPRSPTATSRAWESRGSGSPRCLAAPT